MFDLRSGWSVKTIKVNIDTLQRDHALALHVAQAVAYAGARRQWFERYPEGALPSWLAYRSNMRLARHYHNGYPVLAPHERQRNPVPRSDIAQASRRYAEFSGMRATDVRQMAVPKLGRAVWVLGKLDFVGYTALREGIEQRYQHKFRKNSRPLLAVSHDGKQLIMLSGAYRVTDRGIEDERS